MDTDILDPIIPYVGPIGGGSFSPKNLVELEGAIPPNAYGFDINLQCGPNTFPHDDIALQISVRFLNRYISLNSSHQGIWGKEIRLSNVPIEVDQKFKITVLCEFNQYKVAINGENYCIFPQRIPCEKVSHLSIDGDVSIARISHKSICNATSNSRTSLASTINNQFNDVQNSDFPPSYDTAMNRNKDAESHNEHIARIAIFHFRYNTCSPLKATLKSGCKTLFIFLSVIAVITLCGYFISLITQYDSNNTEDTSFTYDIPSLDLGDINKMNKEADDAISEAKRINEYNEKVNDATAQTKIMDNDNKYFFDLLRRSNLEVQDNKKVNVALEKAKKTDEEKFFSDLLRTSNLKSQD